MFNSAVFPASHFTPFFLRGIVTLPLSELISMRMVNSVAEKSPGRMFTNTLWVSPAVIGFEAVMVVATLLVLSKVVNSIPSRTTSKVPPSLALSLSSIIVTFFTP